MTGFRDILNIDGAKTLTGMPGNALGQIHFDTRRIPRGVTHSDDVFVAVVTEKNNGS